VARGAGHGRRGRAVRPPAGPSYAGGGSTDAGGRLTSGVGVGVGVGAAVGVGVGVGLGVGVGVGVGVGLGVGSGPFETV
jgi:hypothetical protein